MKRTLLLVSLLAALVCAGAWGSKAHAATTYPQLDRLGSIMAMRPITVECANWHDDGALAVAWGYTYLAWSKVVVDERLCAAALGDEPLFRTLAAADSDYVSFQALGIKTIVHEAFHARHWRFRGDEGRVECQAIRHTNTAARILGRTEEQADALMPYALFWYWQTAQQIDGYGYTPCKAPFWLPPEDRDR